MIFMLPKIKIGIEKWKYNKRLGIYVSDLGNFKDVNKKDIHLKVEKNGYLMIPLYDNEKGIIKYAYAHRVVMETWCPKADMWKKKFTVDHLDHNKRNNSYKNLEWVTAEENQKRAEIDFLFDDKDRIIQSLKSRISELLQINKKITIVNNGKTFDNWDEVINYLIAHKRITCENYNKENVIRKIQRAANTQTKYCNYKWRVYQ